MNLTTVFIEVNSQDYVAKWVRAGGAAALDHGSAIGARLAASCIATGDPLRTTAGELSYTTPDGGRVALLRYVPGAPLIGETDAEQELVGTTLARVHTVDISPDTSRPFMADMLDLAHNVEPWVRPAVTAAMTEYTRLPPLTWSILHTDPSPEAFLHDQTTGQVGIVDWSGATHGPTLYEVASAVMYLGGRQNATTFLASYVENNPGLAAEVAAHLDSFSRFRAAVQASYFSMRVATSDLTGIEDLRENQKGLRDAQRMLATHGITTHPT